MLSAGSIEIFLHEAVYHKCLICACGILCDEELIRRHIVSKHAIAILDEYRQHVQNAYKKTNSDYNDKAYLKSYTSLPVHLTKTVVSKMIGNLCTFACDKCPRTFEYWDKFLHHKRIFHAEIGPQNKKFDSKHVKQGCYYQCRICHLYILCDKRMIKSHAAYSHKISSLGKFTKYIEENNLNHEQQHQT